jgi:plasmid stabilization system protein ParE
MKRDVFLTRQAEADLDAILAWLSGRSPTGAKSWFKALEAAISWLEKHADSCPHSRQKMTGSKKKFASDSSRRSAAVRIACSS